VLHSFNDIGTRLGGTVNVTFNGRVCCVGFRCQLHRLVFLAGVTCGWNSVCGQFLLYKFISLFLT